MITEDKILLTLLNQRKPISTQDLGMIYGCADTGPEVLRAARVLELQGVVKRDRSGNWILL